MQRSARAFVRTFLTFARYIFEVDRHRNKQNNSVMCYGVGALAKTPSLSWSQQNAEHSPLTGVLALQLDMPLGCPASD